MAMIDFNGMSYHVDNKLMQLWAKYSLDNLNKTNNDRFFIVDGRERIGKSTWAIQQACAIDKNMQNIDVFLSRICFSPKDFDNACKNTKNGVIIFDEAFRGFSSRAALSKVNKQLISTLMEMGQNNNIVFLILPSFFMLDIYPAMLRSDALFNIYIDKKTSKRSFRGWNRKDKNRIYQMGTKKGWIYPLPTRFRGRFYDDKHHSKFPGGMEFYNAYEKKKQDALKNMKLDMEGRKETTGEEKYIEKFYKAVIVAGKDDNGKELTTDEHTKRLNDGGVKISRAQVGLIRKKYRDLALKSSYPII